MVYRFLVFGFWFLSPYSVFSSALSDLAAALKPGSWALLKTDSIRMALEAGGVSGFIFGYSNDIAWDPGTEQLMFVGGDHGTAPQFVTYSTAANLWRIEPNPSWLPGPTMHGNDHNTQAPSRGLFFHLKFGSRTVYQYDISAKGWSSLPDIPSSIMSYMTCCIGMEYFPEMDGIVVAGGGDVVFFDLKTRQWRSLGSPPGMAVYSSPAEYDPVHKAVLIGDGQSIYKLDAAGKITALKPAPAALTYTNPFSNLTVDPVSGLFYLVSSDRKFYSFDIAKDEWKVVLNFVPFKSFGAVSTPISNYGVIMYVVTETFTEPKVYIYKPPAVAMEKAVPPPLGAVFRVDPKQAAVYNLRGRRMAGPLRAGVYVARARRGSRIFSSKFVVQN